MDDWKRLTPGTREQQEDDLVLYRRGTMDKGYMFQSGFEDEDGILHVRLGLMGLFLVNAEALAFVQATGLWRQVPEVKALVDALELARSTLGNVANPPSYRIKWAMETIDEALAPYKEAKDAP